MSTDPQSGTDSSVLLLRLAGPVQSWGEAGAFNRRDTRPEPTKSGVLGLLAAAQGRSREDPLEDLAALRFGVRTDQPGSLLRDYHTVSDYRGVPLRQAGVSAAGIQKNTSPAKHTHVTVRFYLQDAVFVAAVAGDTALVTSLAGAVRKPAFPLALGRRSCPPTQPLLLGVHTGELERVLGEQPWQAAAHAQRAYRRRHPTGHPGWVDLPATLDDPAGDDVRRDVPVSFRPTDRHYSNRRIRHTWLSVPTSDRPDSGATEELSVHDPFALLGW